MITEAAEEAEEAVLVPGRGKAARILAIIGLLIMLGLIVWLVVCLITDSPRTVAVLFVVILYPVILYLFFWIKKVFSK